MSGLSDSMFSKPAYDPKKLKIIKEYALTD